MAEEREELKPETEEEAEPQSLRDVIRGAVEKQRSGAEAEEKSAKEEPEETEAESKEDKPRDDKGRFVGQKQEKEDVLTTLDKAYQDKALREKGLLKEDPVVPRPPPGWSVKAKSQFDSLPDDVKTAIATRETEIDKGFAKLRDYNGLDPWVELAKRNGTTLVEAVKNYNHFENALASDFLAGITLVCQRFNVNPLSLANSIIAKAGGVPTQIGASGNPPQNQNPGVDLTPIRQELNQLRSHLAGQQQREIQTQIDAFASDPRNKYYENVRPQMAQLIEAGIATDLKTAYEAASWMNPDVRQAIMNDQSQAGQAQIKRAQKAAAAVNARAASKAVTGAPATGSNEPADRRASTRSLREEIVAAVERQRA